jgi:ribosomal protein L19
MFQAGRMIHHVAKATVPRTFTAAAAAKTCVPGPVAPSVYKCLVRGKTTTLSPDISTATTTTTTTVSLQSQSSSSTTTTTTSLSSLSSLSSSLASPTPSPSPSSIPSSLSLSRFAQQTRVLSTATLDTATAEATIELDTTAAAAAAAASAAASASASVDTTQSGRAESDLSTYGNPLPLARRTYKPKYIMSQLKQEEIGKIATDSNRKIDDFRSGDRIVVKTFAAQLGKPKYRLLAGVCLWRRNRAYDSLFLIRTVIMGTAVEYAIPIHSPWLLEVRCIEKGNYRHNNLRKLRELPLSFFKVAIPEDMKPAKKAQTSGKKKKKKPKKPMNRRG